MLCKFSIPSLLFSFCVKGRFPNHKMSMKNSYRQSTNSAQMDISISKCIRINEMQLRCNLCASCYFFLFFNKEKIKFINGKLYDCNFFHLRKKRNFYILFYFFWGWRGNKKWLRWSLEGSLCAICRRNSARMKMDGRQTKGKIYESLKNNFIVSRFVSFRQIEEKIANVYYHFCFSLSIYLLEKRAWF